MPRSNHKRRFAEPEITPGRTALVELDNLTRSIERLEGMHPPAEQISEMIQAALEVERSIRINPHLSEGMRLEAGDKIVALLSRLDALSREEETATGATEEKMKSGLSNEPTQEIPLLAQTAVSRRDAPAVQLRVVGEEAPISDDSTAEVLREEGDLEATQIRLKPPRRSKKISDLPTEERPALPQKKDLRQGEPTVELPLADEDVEDTSPRSSTVTQESEQPQEAVVQVLPEASEASAVDLEKRVAKAEKALVDLILELEDRRLAEADFAKLLRRVQRDVNFLNRKKVGLGIDSTLRQRIDELNDEWLKQQAKMKKLPEAAEPGALVPEAEDRALRDIEAKFVKLSAELAAIEKDAASGVVEPDSHGKVIELEHNLGLLKAELRQVPTGSMAREILYTRLEDERRKAWRVATRLGQVDLRPIASAEVQWTPDEETAVEQEPIVEEAHPTLLPVRERGEPPTPPLALRRGESVVPMEEEPIKPAKVSILERGLTRVRSGWDYVVSLGKNKTTEFLRTQFVGELTDVERGERPLTKLEITERVAASLAGAAATTFGVMLPVDAARYMSQRYFVRREREAIGEALRAAVQERVASDGVGQRAADLAARIEASKYLTPEKRRVLQERLEQVMERHAEEKGQIDKAFAKEAGELLSDAIRTRITGTKVVKESVNTALMLSGLSVLRGGAYGAIALAERWRAMTKEATPERGQMRIKQFIIEGFTEWSKKFAGSEGRNWTERRLNQVQALSVLLKAAGLAHVTLEALPEAAEAVHGYLEKVFAHFEGGLAPVHEAPLNVVTEVPEVQPAEHAVEQTIEAPVAMVPETGIVKAEDGITQVLARMIERNPQAYGYSGSDDDYLMHRFAVLRARDLAQKVGVMDLRLTAEAIDHLAIVPEKHGDSLTATFLDAATGHKIGADELVKLGYAVK